eukprot:scaffold2396_cov89-Amphora_coffeaeformis.AAC.2
MPKSAPKGLCSVVLLDHTCDALSQKQASLLGNSFKSREEKKGTQITPIVIHNLTKEEAKALKTISFESRQNIYSDLSEIHSSLNPRYGYTLVEKVVDCVRRILGHQSIIDALQLPKRPVKGSLVRRLTLHPNQELVCKVLDSVMATISSKDHHTDLNFFTKGRVSQKKIKNQSDDEYLEDYLEEYESDMKGEMCETMDEWYINKQKSETHDPNYKEGPEELFAIMKHMVQKDAAHKKRARKAAALNLTRSAKKNISPQMHLAFLVM